MEADRQTAADKIIKIINEEAFDYYSGQKRVEDVAGIIQNRIQLYVNEGGIFAPLLVFNHEA